MVDEKGNLKDLQQQVHFCCDISSIAGQFPKAIGLSLASKIYRNTLKKGGFSSHGNETTFASIGDGGTSEGIFWEAVNAAAVNQIPLIIPIWDNNYAISVESKYQTPKK